MFTDGARQRPKAALVGGGIGIAPVRALLEEMAGDLAVVYRVIGDGDVIFGEELHELAERRRAAFHLVVGDHLSPEGRRLL